MLNRELIESIKAELSGLYLKLPALEKEKADVFRMIDNAPHMTPTIRLEIHELYNRDLAWVQSNISDMESNLKRLTGGGSDVS